VSLDLDSRLAALAAEHHAPSSALAVHASVILQEAATERPQELPEIARRIIRAQPAMAAVVAAANVALRALEALGANSVGTALAALQRGIEADRRAAAQALCDIIDEPVRVVTYSASASVIEALLLLRQQDLLLDVVCGESRPLLEGTALARWLASEGYDVLVTTDAALAGHFAARTVFVVGTDAILPHGVAHKRGTRLLAAWAQLAGTPRYVLATRDRLYLPDLLPLFANPEHPAGEVVHEPPAGMKVENLALDVTPRATWSGIFIGAKSLDEAEQSGDHALARGLSSLVAEPSGPVAPRE
jgi:translation initiation factor 2B subunit (eIF-2B alpha/beta/delta family)